MCDTLNLQEDNVRIWDFTANTKVPIESQDFFNSEAHTTEQSIQYIR